jgi:hypothetical protein
MAFTFRLERENGTPADPPVLHTAVPNWQVGDTIPLGRDETLCVNCGGDCAAPVKAHGKALRVVEIQVDPGWGAGASSRARLGPFG